MIKLLAALLLLAPMSLSAQNLVNESKTGLGMGPSLSLSEVDYKNENENTFTFKRKTLGFVLNAPLNSDIGALFQAGYTWHIGSSQERPCGFLSVGIVKGKALIPRFLLYGLVSKQLL